MSIKSTFELTYLKLKCNGFRFNYYYNISKYILLIDNLFKQIHGRKYNRKYKA